MCGFSPCFNNVSQNSTSSGSQPRIDPIQLLRCLSVLLSPNGGIKSNDEVHRLASLMTKFSKKLVSKCIYIQILKCTETELLGSFMGSGGWRLAHMWLTESIVAKNWPLVRELLELLLLCPVDVDRLKTNNCPKLVKELSKDGSQAAIRALAAKLVEQWLKALRGEIVIPILESNIPLIISEANNFTCPDSTLPDLIPGPSNTVDENEESVVDNPHEAKTNELKDDCSMGESSKNEAMIALTKENTVKEEEASKEVEALPILKISLKDGKQVVSKLEESDSKKNRQDMIVKEHKSSKGKSKSSNSKNNDNKSSSSKSSAKHLSSSRSHSSKSSNEKHRSSSKSSNSSSSSSKDKSRDRSKESSSRHSSSSSDKHKDRRHSSKSNSSSSHKSKDDKSKTDKSHKSVKIKEENTDKNNKEHTSLSDKEQNEKNRLSSDKPQPLSIHKMMKIPKLSETHRKETPSISIEARKPNDPNRPKTVKTFHSKFRSHGLEEEAKPPPPRGSVMKKPSLIIPPTVTVPKRQSPSHSIEAPPEKKIKTIEPTEKPGSIKLIPAKPKPVLLESDMFMDALNASATNKKEPKKRKRRTSGSKDGNPTASDVSPPNTPTTTAATSPNGETKSTPFRFYKDTLEIEEEKEKEKPLEKESEVTENTEPAISPPQEVLDKEDKADIEESHVRTGLNGMKGVLCYHKKKGPKKSIRWRPDAELEQIQYFELDETERVNVSKTFTDMKHLERVHEREVFQKARNLINDDNMEVRTTWRPLIPVDIGGAIVVDYGKNSKERELQASRQKSVLQSLFLKSMIPDSPSDPDVEVHPHNEPTIIPLDDITGNQDTVSDFRNTPWPEPKAWPEPKGGVTSSNITSNNINMPPMFPPMPPFPGPFPNAQFGMAGFQGSGSVMIPPSGEWQNNMPPNVMVPGGMPPGAMVPVPGSMPPVLMNPPNMPPGLMMPPDSSMMGPDMFGGPGQMFQPTMPPESFNMMDSMNGPQNMFAPGFPVNMPGGPPGSESGGPPFPFGSRGGARGRGSSNQWRGNWDGPRGRGSHAQGGWKNAKCIHFMKKGSCRSGESCPYMHPGVNCPY